jgi:hypothetical protein
MIIYELVKQDMDVNEHEIYSLKKILIDCNTNGK